MPADVASKALPSYNPTMLRWARDTAGISIEEAAKRAGVKVDQIADWESKSPTRMPTVRQARQIADLYKVPYLEFFRPEPPVLPNTELVPDFRLFRAAEDPSETKGLKSIQLWAEVQRLNALDLFYEIGDEPPKIPKILFTTIEADVDDLVNAVRTAINFPIEAQIGRNADGRREIPRELRKRIESLGILTLRRTDLKHLRVRGLCIAVFPLPVLVIGSEAPTGEAFTLAHELAHLLIRQSAISGPIPRTGGDAEKRRTEEWCNRFASAFLMPRAAVTAYLAPPKKPRSEISDDEIHRAALHFGVSDHAMLIRLVHLGYVTANFYWNVKKPQFEKQEEEYKGGGIPAYYGTRYRNKQGDLYTALVLDAWSMGRITGHNAAEYMGIKNIKHVIDIRNNFGRG